MRKIFILFLILLNQQTFASGDIGGMDGGGGGTLPAYPVSIYQVQEIVFESKHKLLYLFNDYEINLKYKTSSNLLEKLFLGPRKVQEVLKDLRVEVRLDQPCLTSSGAEVDASIHGIKPNTICISALRISKKVDVAVAQRETLALLAHEVSHFMGANEAEAIELQKDISWSILNSPQDSEINTEVVRSEISGVLSSLRKTLEVIEMGQYESASEWFSKTLLAISRFDAAASSGIYKVFNPRENEYQNLLNVKLRWARNFLKTMIPGPDQTDDQNEYEASFKGKDYFLLKDQFYLNDHLYAHEKIFKIKSAAELQDLMKSIEQEYEVRSAYVWQSTFGNNWLLINGHFTKTFDNPWGNFSGKYTVQNANCNGSSNFYKDVKEINIYRSGNTLFFGKSYNGGYSNDRIELGAYNVNTYLNDHGLISENKVYMTHEMGGSWSDRTYLDRTVSRLTLETFQDQTFNMTIENTFEDQDVTKPDAKSNCILTGVFQK